MQTGPADETIVYEATREGLRLPVIDVTHPRFHVPQDATAQMALENELRQSERRRLIPGFVMRWMLKSAVRQSRLLGALFGGRESFLDGITIINKCRIRLIMRGLNGFSPLAKEAGFSIRESLPTIWSDQVVFRPYKEPDKRNQVKPD